MAKFSFKKSILKLHQILGLVTGIVVFIVSITGCLWVFKDEIESLYVEPFIVVEKDGEMITATQAQNLAKEVFPNKHVHGTIFGQPNEALEVIFYELDPEFYQSVFLNPYTGEILGIQDHFSGFFAFVLKGHVRLWLPAEIGEQVVSISVFLFMFILVSGLILWWPKKRKNLKQRLKFDWKATTKWKRKNFDLHSVLGFYVYILGFILAFTGSIMAFNWMYSSVYKGIGGEKTAMFYIPNNKTEKDLAETNAPPIDRLISRLRREDPAALNYEIHYPYADSVSIYVEVAKTDGLYYENDYRYFDQTTLEEIETEGIYGKYGDAKLADKLIRMNYDIHVGAIGGIFGKIIAFLSSLVVASLPVTGILLWYGRKYKRKNPVSSRLSSRVS
ncbi:PepSY-associated TM helix domain-containing protein [Cytophaga sp. FL35]|uniref:PepSY-associated TM helix domain-containing protein n=1 Tax=Cytophaga sp. FL35 TaxID=1904456 RepID=UPI0016536202|nr:PepSY-associated TM helix domain-containing protein [Cytophaga sp. FL35]MBC6998284.1 PepSY domain-containing protein [Cytophaga sp. FL35]